MWLLYASELSSAIGANKYKKKWETLFNVFKRLNKGEFYQKALERLEKKGYNFIDDDTLVKNVTVDHNMEGDVDTLLSQKPLTSQHLEQAISTFESNIMKNEETILQRKEKLQQEVKRSVRDIEKLDQEFQTIEHTLQEQKQCMYDVTHALNTETDPNKLQTLQTQQDDLLKSLSLLQEKSSTTLETKEELSGEVSRISQELEAHATIWNNFKTAKKKIISKAQTEYGNRKEDDIVESKAVGVIVDNNTKFYKMEVGIEPVVWGVGGRIDGFRNGILIEIKNRKSKLFDPVPIYDLIQLQTYMQILNVPRATIIQCLTDEFEVYQTLEKHFERSDKLWEYITKPLQVFVHVLHKFAHDTALQDKFFLSPDHKKSYVINPLFTYYKKKVVNLSLPSDAGLIKLLGPQLLSSEIKMPKTRKRKLETPTSSRTLIDMMNTQDEDNKESATPPVEELTTAPMSVEEEKDTSTSSTTTTTLVEETQSKKQKTDLPTKPVFVDKICFFDDPNESKRQPMDFTRPLRSYLPEEWATLLSDQTSDPYFSTLETFVDQEYKTTTIYPPREQVFRALELCSVDHVKVVIIGCDPYINPQQAHGLAFSVVGKVPHPPSLRNIFQEIQRDLGLSYPKSGNLESWASQGVLLLNPVLTVRAGHSSSHSNKAGWERFTAKIIELVSQRNPNLVFMLWGRPAQNIRQYVKNQEQHLFLETSHPSPLAAFRGFKGCGHFSETNKYLESQGKTPINWQIE